MKPEQQERYDEGAAAEEEQAYRMGKPRGDHGAHSVHRRSRRACA